MATRPAPHRHASALPRWLVTGEAHGGVVEEEGEAEGDEWSFCPDASVRASKDSVDAGSSALVVKHARAYVPQKVRRLP